MVHNFGGSWGRTGQGLQIWNRKLMPVEEYEAHIAKVRAAMKENNITTLLLNNHTIYFRSRPVTILPIEGSLIIMSLRERGPVGERGTVALQRRYDWVREMITPCERDLDLNSREIRAVIDMKGLIGGKIGYVGFEHNVEQLASLKREIYESEFVDATQLMQGLLAIKSEREINLVKKAIELGDIGYKALLANAKPGVKDGVLLAEIDYAVKLGGAQDHKVALSIGADVEKVLLPGLLALDKELANGDIVLYNACIQYHDYWAEIGRTIAVGTPSKRQTALYTAAATAQQAGIAATKTGAKASDIAKAIIQTVKDAGYEQYLNEEYGLGHGVGLTFDEAPFIAEDNDTTLKAGMIVVVKVGLHASGIGGAFLADTLVVTDAATE